MRFRDFIWVLVVGFAATLLGRAMIIFDIVPFACQGPAAALVFVAAAALMIESRVAADGMHEMLREIAVAAFLAAAFALRARIAPTVMYLGIFMGAASEEVVFRRWLPRATADRAASSRFAGLFMVTIPALAFSISHLLVQQRFSPDRTGRLLALLFVVAILYSELVRIGGLGLSVVLHALLNAVAVQVTAIANRPNTLSLLLLVSATGASALSMRVLSQRMAGRWRPPMLALHGAGHAALLATSLSAITGNFQLAPMLASLAACWALARIGSEKHRARVFHQLLHAHQE